MFGEVEFLLSSVIEYEKGISSAAYPYVRDVSGVGIEREDG